MRRHAGTRRLLGFAVAALALVLLGTHARAADPLKIPDAALEPVAFADLEGWADDDHAAAFATLAVSCKAIARGLHTPREPRPMLSGLRAACHHVLAFKPRTAQEARAFFEKHFRPVRITRLGDTVGFLTGYYEPIVAGSRVRTGEFSVPMYRRPADLVMLGSRGGDDFANRGTVVRKFGRKPVPYYDRGAIEAGALAGRRLELCWVKDPIEAMFIQIQGSARVRLADGSILRLNYDAHNGLPYTAVGRILVERGLVPREEMSMARIRRWMREHPAEAPELRRQNRSFVFFRAVKLGEHDEPIGAQGIPVTAGRTLAVDQKLHVYGTPFWIDADLPLTDLGTAKFRRLMIAQDTGSAIIGPARADLYFGAGDEAGRIAGRIRNPGRFVMLIPREIDPVEAGKHAPMPRARPATVPAEAEASGPAPVLPPPRPPGPKG